ncbi:MAG: hypothetical protein RLZZ292_3680 [Bacteroidota bacterium]|jgi:hypothetical protein
MKETLYNELIAFIEEMIADDVKLIHAGRIIDWEDTKVIETLEKIKQNSEFNPISSTLKISFGDN